VLDESGRGVALLGCINVFSCLYGIVLLVVNRWELRMFVGYSDSVNLGYLLLASLLHGGA
jgi:hypothetical protein